jgi:P-type conjugative transfer protein TrbJ
MSLRSKIPQRFAAAVAAGVLTWGAMAPAHAIFGVGDIVYDPENFAQNVLSAARALTQIENQIKQLENDALNLTGLDFSELDRLREVLASTKNLVDQAEGLAFQLDRVRTEFRRLYPQAYGEGSSFEQMIQDALDRWNYSRQALDTAMQLQAQASENNGEDEAMLAELIDHSQHAVGALQVAEATNQLLALQARQMIQAQQLALTQDRAVALEQGRALAAEARSRELRRRFMTRETLYTPETIRGLD